MTRVPTWITSVLAGAVAVLVGASVLSVATAAGEPAHEFSGEYVDGRHGVSDFGQRWYDPEHQVFLSSDPAPVDDPGLLTSDPLLAQAYALNHANSYRYTDPDGRMPMGEDEDEDEEEEEERASTKGPSATFARWKAQMRAMTQRMAARIAGRRAVAPAPVPATTTTTTTTTTTAELEQVGKFYNPGIEVDPEPLPELQTVGKRNFEISVDPPPPVGITRTFRRQHLFLTDWLNGLRPEDISHAIENGYGDMYSWGGVLNLFIFGGLRTPDDSSRMVAVQKADEAEMYEWPPENPTSGDPPE